jgi:hypothetical protein
MVVDSRPLQGLPQTRRRRTKQGSWGQGCRRSSGPAVQPKRPDGGKGHMMKAGGRMKAAGGCIMAAWAHMMAAGAADGSNGHMMTTGLYEGGRGCMMVAGAA